MTRHTIGTVSPARVDQPGKQGRRVAARGAYLAVALVVAVAITACDGDKDTTTRTTTTKDNLFANPSPAPWYPFTPGSDASLKPDDYKDKLPLSQASAGCPLKVKSLTVYDKNQVKSALKFNTGPRGSGGSKATNGGNTALGPVYEGNGFGKIDWYHYKYEVEVVYEGTDMSKALYGQMISDAVKIADQTPDVTFHDDGPANDWVGKQWLLKPGEKKSDFPVIEVSGNTVYWIDAPGGPESMVGGIANYKMYVIVYAGACGKITDLSIFLLSFPKGKNPTKEDIPNDKLGQKVKSYKFK